MERAVAETGDTTIQLKRCPRCRVAIRRNLRYGSIINQVLADIEQVRYGLRQAFFLKSLTLHTLRDSDGWVPLRVLAIQPVPKLL